MTRRWWPAGLLVAVAALGWLAAWAAPSGTHVGGLWPVGLASGVLLLAGRRAALFLLVLAPAAFAGFVAAERPLDVSAAAAVAIAAEVTVVWLVLRAGRAGPPTLRTFPDLDRYAAAAVLGASTAALVMLVAGSVTGYGDPALVALATGASHLSSQLTLLPFFLHPLSERPTAGVAERVLSWVSVVVVTLIVFRVEGLPVLGFLVMPLLVWGALRLGTWQAFGQVVVVALIGDVFYSLGYGPISWVPAGLGDRADVAALLLQLFEIGCVLVVMPLTVLVSLRRGADREAASERDKLASVVAAARGVAIIGADPQGRITLFNPGAERLLGYRSEEVIGGEGAMFHSETSIRAKAAELDVAPDYRSVAQRMLEPDQAGGLLPFRRSDGDERAHRVTISEIVDDRGTVSGYLSTSEDVTEQIRAQEAVERSLQRMQEVDVLKDALVSTVSHELRTPVTSIVGYLEMLEDDEFGALTGAQRGAVARVRGSCSRLLVLVDDLLTLARTQDSSRADPGARVLLAEVVASGCAVVAPQAAAGSVGLLVGAEVPGTAVLGDRDSLEGVVINLVGNAVKFTPEGGTVEVGVALEGSEVVLVVRDTGIGIPAEEIEHLFSRFFRSSLTLQRGIPGSGLGLAIAHAVVQRMRGTIAVESEVGVGTRFSVRLPQAPAAG